jgi:adenylate kinase
MTPFKNFVLIGRSGCGKGTQANLLIEKLGNLHHISTGDLFRKLASSESATAKKIAEVIESGGLPFDDIATTLWMYEIAHHVKEGQGFILDGAPRRLNEAANFDRFMDFLGQTEETAILLIDISRPEAFRRLMKRGERDTRADDAEEFINNRLDYYEERVVPVVECYEKEGRLVRINGEQPVEHVHKEILEKLHLE